MSPASGECVVYGLCMVCVCDVCVCAAVVESHRDLSTSQTHTHTHQLPPAHAGSVFSGSGGEDVRRHPPTHLPSLMHCNLQHICRVPHKCLYFTHPLTSSLVLSASQRSTLILIEEPHQYSNVVNAGACLVQIFQVQFDMKALRGLFRDRLWSDPKDVVDSVLTCSAAFKRVQTWLEENPMSHNIMDVMCQNKKSWKIFAVNKCKLHLLCYSL